MEIRKRASDIEALIEDRVTAGVLEYPDDWVQETGLRVNREHRLTQTVRLRDWTTFFRREVEIAVNSEGATEIPSFQYNDGPDFSAHQKNISNGLRNIAVGNVSITEHALAIHTAIGLRANWVLTAKSSRLDPGVSFPTFQDTSGSILDMMLPHLQEFQESEFTTVTEPVGFDFGDGSYCVIYPDEGDHVLNIDHQIIHPKNAIGSQRVVFDITPDRFAYLCRARTPGYGLRKTVFDLIGEKGTRMFGGSFTTENVLFVGKRGFVNARPEFVDRDGINREVLMHEIVDKLAFLALLDKRLVGKIVFNRTNHAKDLQVEEALEKGLLTN